jgi:peptidoglycan/LPS O-acetylase OafA/YrhL
MVVGRNYVQGLDLLRGICGYVVAVCHYQWLVNKVNYFEYISILFVEFFFILSGFVLAPQLIKIIKEKKFIMIFFKRRWLRTIPLYLLSLIIVSIITNNLFNKDFLFYFLFLNKSLPNLLENDYFAVAWSLAVEEYFYLIFPLVIYLFFNEENFKKKSINFFIILSVIAIFSSFFVDNNFYRTGTFLRIDSILCGFLLAIFFIETKIKLKFILTFLIVLILLYYYFYKFKLYSSDIFYVKILFLYLIKVISVFILLLFYKINLGLYFNKIFQLFANQTYSIYLLHLPLIYIINSQKDLNLNLFQYCLLLFIISTLVYYLFEKPILSIRPKYEKD